MTTEQLRALIMAILSIDSTNRQEQPISQLALEADEIIQHAREPFFRADDAER